MNTFFKKTKKILLPLIICAIFAQGLFGFAGQAKAQYGSTENTTAIGATTENALTSYYGPPQPGESCSVITNLLSAAVKSNQAVNAISQFFGGSSGGSDLLAAIGCVVTMFFSWISSGLLFMSANILYISGQLFDYALDWSMNISALVKGYPVIALFWQILRDIANLCFMFILLYIAIMTILRASSFNTKRVLIMVIISAILLNFSFLFASFVIDTSNIIATAIFADIATTGSQPAGNNNNTALAHGISGLFIQGLGLTTVYDTAGSGTTVDTLSNKIVGYAPDTWTFVFICLGGSVLFLVVAYVLLAASVLFIIRVVVLIFLLMSSSIAVAASALPETRGYFKKWLSALLHQSFFIAAYVLMMYFTAKIIQVTQSGSGVTNPNGGGNLVALGQIGPGPINLYTMLTGGLGTGWSNSLFTFILLLTMMVGALIVASMFGAYGSKTILAIGKDLAGRASFGLSGAILRRGVGGFGDKFVNSDTGKKWRTGNVLQRAAFKSSKYVAGSSFDARNIKVVGGLNLGKAGGKGGYTQLEKDRNKKLMEEGEEHAKLTNREKDEIAKLEEDKRNFEKTDAYKVAQMAIEVKKKQIKDAEDERNALTADLNTYKADTAKIEADKKKLDDEKKAMEAESKALEEERVKLEEIARRTRDTTSAQRLAAKEDEIKAKKAQIDDKEAEIQTKNAELAPRDSVTKTKEAAVNERNDFISSRKQEIKSTEDGLKDDKEAIQTNIERIKDRGKERRTEFANFAATPRIIGNPLGPSPAERAAIANLRKGEKSENDKLLDKLKKALKDEEKAAAPTPGSIPPPAASAGGGGTGTPTT